MPDPDLTSMPQEELDRVMNEAARAVKAALPPGSFFALIACASYGPGQYVSNANPASMIPRVLATMDRVAANRNPQRN